MKSSIYTYSHRDGSNFARKDSSLDEILNSHFFSDNYCKWKKLISYRDEET